MLNMKNNVDGIEWSVIQSTIHDTYVVWLKHTTLFLNIKFMIHFYIFYYYILWFVGEYL